MRTHASCALVLVAAYAGCAVGPDYERPTVETPRSMPEATPRSAPGDGSIAITDAEPPARWWTLFHDPQLESLIAEAHLGNQGLRSAVARVHAARAVVKEAFAPLFPTIGATAQYNYLRFAPNAIPFNPQVGQVFIPGTPITQTSTSTAQNIPTTVAFNGTPFQVWSGTADMSYELDLWGRIRRALEASQAEEAATEEDKKNVEITLAADVAEAYFDIGEAQAELAISQEAVRTRERTVEVISERFERGLVPELDVRRARSELARARAQIPDAERRKAVAEHRLAVLLGRMPTLRFDGRAPAAFELPPELPAGLPSTLLERRPDIRAAEMRLHGAHAKIGEAIANFFPQLTLFGRFGYASLNITTIAQGGAQTYAAGPSLRIPIFEGGRTYAQKLEAEANTDTAAGNYYAAILTAFREVADAVVSIGAQQRVRDQQKISVAEAEQARALATEQYEKGLTNYLTVLDAQRTALDASLSLVQAQRLLLSDIVQLEKALGGGWTDVPQDDAEPSPGH